MGLFDNLGASTTTNTNTGGSLFGNLGASTTASNIQPTNSIFGSTTNKPSLFGQSTAQPTQPAGQTSLFGQTTTQPAQSGGIFGSSTALKPATGSIFGQSANNPTQNAFGQTQQLQQQQLQLQQQQPTERPLDQTLRFGFSTTQQTAPPQALTNADPWWREGRGMGTYKSIPGQMAMIKDKWDPASFSSPLRTYIYQHVHSEAEAFKYRPGPGEDEQKWEDAVQSRPGPEWVPLLVRSFYDLGKKAQIQQEAIAKCNMILHEINTSLDLQLEAHRNKVSARLSEARRRHRIISQRTLALAAKVQMLRNRGYVMDNAEEELKAKLQILERELLDPSIHAREQEVWARMLGIRERAKRLKMEMEKLMPQTGVVEDEEPLLDEETVRAAKRTLEAYDTQLKHLQKELLVVQEEYIDWEGLSLGSNTSNRRR